ncbi:MAG: 3-hydroxybutyryl-CoA dehydrogenase, partial [Cryomorphaceae bacterium]|nr:3-hydroxybutyryl-CoA dehydrogenase [Cryomorphaceae bacterium]
MKNITVIGAGTMGNGIAHVFAQSGFTVHLFDISEAALERALSTITKNMDRQIAKEKLTESDKVNALGRLATGTDLKKAVAE